MILVSPKTGQVKKNGSASLTVSFDSLVARTKHSTIVPKHNTIIQKIVRMVLQILIKIIKQQNTKYMKVKTKINESQRRKENPNAPFKDQWRTPKTGNCH